MTVDRINAVVQAKANEASNNSDSLQLKEGDVIQGNVISLSDTAISIAKDGSDQIMELKLDHEMGFKVHDRVQVDILKVSVENIEVTINKLEEEKIANHDPIKDSVNFDDVKRAIVQSENPLQYSKELDYHIEHAKAEVNALLENFTDNELGSIIREGFDPTKMTTELLYQVGYSNRIDKRLELEDNDERSVKISVNDEKIKEIISEIASKHTFATSDKELMSKIAKELIHNDLPVNAKNVEKVLQFSEKVDKVKDLSQDDLVKFLSSDKKSTVGELYKSLYTSLKTHKKDILTENEFESVKVDVNRILNRELMSETNHSETLTLSQKEIEAIGKALVTKGVPLDDRAIATIKFVYSEFNEEDAINDGISQLKKNEKLSDFTLSDLSSLSLPSKEELQEISKVIHEVKPNHIQELVVEHRPVNIKELSLQVEVMDEVNENQTINNTVTKKVNQVQEVVNLTSTDQFIVDKAVEDLEVIRYQMTLKSALHLSVEGVDLRTSNLSLIRQRLEDFELKHVKRNKAIDNGIEPPRSVGNELKVALPRDSQVQVDVKSSAQSLSKHEQAVLEVKEHMAVISGASTKSIANIAISQKETITLESAVAEIHKVSVSEATMRYDELRTEVRSDLGDRIENAFTNVSNILEDLDLSVTKYNTRAVEILARNEMPLTATNIEAVKFFDISMQEIFDKMMPSHIKTLVDSGVSITQEPIENLVGFLQGEEASVLEDSSEAVAKQLIALSKSSTVTADEREALVGVYKMMHTIESSKGAAVGFLVDNNMDVTLENLFDAAKNIGRGNMTKPIMDFDIDDSFGILEKLKTAGATIKEKIASGFLEKETELNDLIKQELNSDLDMSKDNLRQEVQALRQMLKSVLKMENTQLRQGVSFEKISLEDWKTVDDMSKNTDYTKSVFQEFNSILQDDSRLREKFDKLMNDYNDDVTLKGYEAFSRSLKSLLKEVKNQRLDSFFDKEFDKNNGLEEEIKVFESLSNKSIYETTKELESGLNISKNLIEQEDYYSVPVLINGEMQQMNMYYFRDDKSEEGSNDDMSVYLSFSTSKLGSVNMRIELSEDRATTSMYATEDRGNRQIKVFEEEFKTLFSDIGFTMNSVSYERFSMPQAVNRDEKISQSNKVDKYVSQLKSSL